MKIDISFIPRSFLSNSLIQLANKEITYPYKDLERIKNNKRELRKFYEERMNYLSLVHQLTKLEEDLLLKEEQILAKQCHDYIERMQQLFTVTN